MNLHLMKYFIFSTTGHGKSSVDAIFGAVKRSARAECLRRGYRNDIINAQGLFNFLSTHINSSGHTSDVLPMIVTTQDYESVRNNETLQKRWERAKLIDGTQQNHDYISDPTDRDFIFVRPYTGCDEYRRVRLMKKN